MVDVTQAETFKFCDSAFRNMDLPLIDKDDFEDIRQALQALCKRHREQATADQAAHIAALEARCDALAGALQGCLDTLRFTRAFMLKKHGTTNPAREDAIAAADAALAQHKGKNDDW